MQDCIFSLVDEFFNEDFGLSNFGRRREMYTFDGRRLGGHRKCASQYMQSILCAWETSRKGEQQQQPQRQRQRQETTTAAT